MALPQRDNLIDEIKRTDALLECAVQMGLAIGGRRRAACYNLQNGKHDPFYYSH